MIRNFHPQLQQAQYRWIPWSFRLGSVHPYFYFPLGGGRYLQWNLLPDADEGVAWEMGRWAITRPETPEEEAERLEIEEEVLAMEAESARFIEWHY